MGNAMQLVFPAAIVASIILASFGYSVMARVPLDSLPNQTSQSERLDELEPASSQALAEQSESNDSPADPKETGEGMKCKVSDKYPVEILQWCALISKHAKNNNLDPDLLAALIWQESGGNPVAYSRSGAVGLMQVMPSDGLAASFMCKNGPCFTNRPSTQELQDPQFNVKYGSGMLAGLLGKYGDMREALKSYGPMDSGYYYADKVLGIFNNYKR